MPGLPQLRRIELAYDGGNSDESVKRLCYALFPKWETEPGDLEIKHFKEGITNTLLRVTKVWPGATPTELDNESVLIRAYGRGTEVIIDREREITTHHLLALHNLAPELLARFQNGMIYRFVSGRPCGPADMRAPRVYRGMAQKLGEWHAVLSVDTQAQSVFKKIEKSGQLADGDASKSANGTKSLVLSTGLKKVEPNIWTQLEKWLNVLPSNTEEERSRNEKFRQEFAWIVSEFPKRTGLGEDSLVVGHGDLLCANMIILPTPVTLSTVSGGEVVNMALIDYEYAIPCHAAFDLACHFSEWIGFECDYEGIPTKHDRREFLAEYLHSYRRHARRTSFNHLRDEPFKVPLKRDDSGENVPQTNGNGTGAQNGVDAKTQSRLDRQKEELDRLCIEVDAFRGLPGFYWGVWGYIQASISDIDFDYDWYGRTRMQEYFDWKAEYDGSRERASGSLPLREKRWNLEA